MGSELFRDLGLDWGSEIGGCRFKGGSKSKLKGPDPDLGSLNRDLGVQNSRFGGPKFQIWGSKNRDFGRFFIFWGFLRVLGPKTFHISAQISAIFG